jgi:putative addiction module component (TIGR02574 family)
MSGPYQQVLHAALALPEGDRAQLLDALLESFTSGNSPPLSDEWRVEIERRSKELEEGTARLTPWSEVRQQAREQQGYHE